MGFLTRFDGSIRAVAADRPLTLTSDEDVSLINRVAFDGGRVTSAGVYIGERSALGISAFFSCDRILAEDVAKLPCILYRRTQDGGKERATDHAAYEVVHDRPNTWQTPYEFKECMQGQLPPSGNAYALINRVRGQVVELLPLPPGKVTPRQGSDWRVTYRIDGESSDRPATDILHLRSFSTDGLRGVSLVSLARESLGLALATERHGGRLFNNMARPSGILTTPGKLSKEAGEMMREQWETATGGDNMHRVVVLQQDTKWLQTGMTSEDAQFLETRQFQLAEIARWFRMPPHKVGILTDATFSNIEMQAIEYVVDTLMPWLVRWEQRLSASLLSAADRRAGLFFEFLIDGLLRGEIKARMEAYERAINAGILSPNEARARENLNPRPGGDEYLRPLNMATSGGPREEQAKAISMAAFLAARDRGGDVDEAGRACVAAYRAALLAA